MGVALQPGARAKLLLRGLAERCDRLRSTFSLAPDHNQIGAIEQELRAALDDRLRVLRTVDGASGRDAPRLAQLPHLGVGLAHPWMAIFARNTETLRQILV